MVKQSFDQVLFSDKRYQTEVYYHSTSSLKHSFTDSVIVFMKNNTTIVITPFLGLSHKSQFQCVTRSVISHAFPRVHPPPRLLVHERCKLVLFLLRLLVVLLLSTSVAIKWQVS